MGHNTVVEFIKAQLSSVVSTACDFCITALVYELLRHVVISTASGAVVGGLVNCCINYRWTFKGTSRGRMAIMWRYLLVWIGSVVLNTSGTEWAVKLAHLWLDTNLSVVMVAKACVAVLVAVLWNFTMQKYFVYKR